MASPKEVIGALIKRIEELEARVTALEARGTAPDEWNAEWDVDDLFVGDDGLDDLDPDERAQVLEARRRLATDTGSQIEEPLEPTQVEVRVTSEGGTAWFPTPTDMQLEMRKQMVKEVGLEELKELTDEEAVRAWLTGGPLWLHAYNREHVLSLPPFTRQKFVFDVMETSNRDAQELGRDILKDENPGTPEASIDNILSQSD